MISVLSYVPYRKITASPTALCIGPCATARSLEDRFWPVFGGEATDKDILIPFVVKQLPAYNWLVQGDRYLAVTAGLPHASIMQEVLDCLIKEESNW